MEIGKIPNSKLKDIILSKLKVHSKDVLIPPGIGEDCAAIDFGEFACILTTDPITGTADKIGKLAIDIVSNDIATSGVKPIGILVNLLAPKNTTEEELSLVMEQLTSTADDLEISIIGGHTEITSAVNRFVIVATGVGKVKKEKLIKNTEVRPGDYLIMTKSAGLEGTAIIAFEREFELLDKFGIEFLTKAKELINSISVVQEGVICSELGVKSMHDVTEGGILGAVWEKATSCNLGIKIYEDKINIKDITNEVCRYFEIDPLKLISSGSMLIATTNGGEIIKILEKNNIEASIIGQFTKSNEIELILSNGDVKNILEPESDELYKVV